MKRLPSVLATYCLALLSACGSQSEPEPAAPAAAPAATPAAPVKPAEEDVTAKMARAVGSGKPGAAVEVKYEFLGKPAIGTPTELQIAVVPNAGVDSLDLTVSGMDGVTLTGALTASFTSVEAGKPYSHTVTLLPDRTGAFYISVAVNTQLGGASLGRTFSIPFVVGSPPAQEKPQPGRDASGETVEPMQAEENRG